MNSTRVRQDELSKLIQAQAGTSLHQDFLSLLQCRLEWTKEQMVVCHSDHLLTFQAEAKVYSKLIAKMTAPVPYSKS